MKRVGFILSFILIFACSKSNNDNPNPTPNPNPNPPADTFFAKGADVSWITEMEAAGKLFYNANGVQTEGMALLKSVGMNAIRLRVWVNPSGGWNGKADVIAKALRAKNLGMKIMIDFHFSDSWADPGQQTKPVAWTNQGLASLLTSISAHTQDILQGLKNAGVAPEWVQVGNETNNGMLWEEGRASANMNAFTQMINSGYDAVKAVFPSAKVIVHLSNGFDNSLFRWMFDGLKANGAKYDIIGLSLYPDPTNWATLNSQAYNNMSDLISRYNKDIMVVEVGMSWDSPNESRAFISDLISKVKLLPNNRGKGVLYWEPLSYASWKGYTKGAFDNSGKPTIALSAFN